MTCSEEGKQYRVNGRARPDVVIIALCQSRLMRAFIVNKCVYNNRGHFPAKQPGRCSRRESASGLATSDHYDVVILRPTVKLTVKREDNRACAGT